MTKSCGLAPPELSRLAVIEGYKWDLGLAALREKATNLEESSTLKSKYSELEEEHEAAKQLARIRYLDKRVQPSPSGRRLVCRGSNLGNHGFLIFFLSTEMSTGFQSKYLGWSLLVPIGSPGTSRDQ